MPEDINIQEIEGGVEIIPGEVTETTIEETPTEEQLIGGKFKTNEELLSAYQELEKKLHTPTTVEDTTQIEIPEKPQTPTEFDLTKFEEEWGSNGGLSEESYEELAGQGYNKEIVDNYIQGKMALAEKWASNVKSLAGGDEEYQQMLTWATAGNLDEGFVKSFNEAVNSQDINKAKMAVEALKSQYEKSNGVEPNLLSGNPSDTASAGDVFESWAQATEAINDPKYERDPAFRDKVLKKIARSKI